MSESAPRILQNYINGKWVPSLGGTLLDVFEPATGKVYAQIPDSDAVDIVHAIQSANKAFEKWSKIPAKERAQFLNRIADGIEKRAEEFALAESKDVGKPLWLAREMDIPRVIENFRFFAGRILHHQEMATDMDGKAINYTLRQPLGVVGLISPWNLPLYLLSWKIAPALACGNTAVCKPSELTPVTAALLCEVFTEVGLPDGVCNVVFGLGSKAGSALVAHPGVPLISFTGGTETGEKVIQGSAGQFKKLSLELGGKNANVIFNDADLAKAVKGSVRSSFLNQGEICLCGSRIYVQEGIYKEFASEFVKEVAALKVGDPMDPNVFMGPVVSAQHLEKIKFAIGQAEKENGKISTGGRTPESLPEKNQGGYFLRPTVIEDLTNCSDLWSREIFGPVVTMTSFKYPLDGIKWANTSPYGLSASLWTQDLAKAHKMAALVQAGTVWVNTWLKRDLRVPFGGMKASGIGREGGDFSIDFYTEQKTVCIDLG